MVFRGEQKGEQSSLTEFKGKIIENSMPMGGGGVGRKAPLEDDRALGGNQVDFIVTQPKSVKS